ncbi:helix-turn-helix domain-containing protein [Niveibacterium sp. SC-1]|uniref:helix-turn-helix domain-containing protein n=1 Tax=Niveibacterium sp. SC-1 TaxID=3135646 RepID=UPI00311E26EC
MSTDKESRLSPQERLGLVMDVLQHGLSVHRAALAYRTSPATVRKWVGRYLAQGEEGLKDKPVERRGRRGPITPSSAMLVLRLRERELSVRDIAKTVEAAESVVAAILERAGLGDAMSTATPIAEADTRMPGELVFIVTARLTAIEERDRFGRGRVLDGEVLFAAMDDCTRVLFAAVHEDESAQTARDFMRHACAFFAALGVAVQRIVTGRRSGFRSHTFLRACREAQVGHHFGHFGSSSANSKSRQAEDLVGLVQSEWGATSHSSASHRRHALTDWQYHYNWKRLHPGLDRTPMAALGALLGGEPPPDPTKIWTP